MGFLKSDKIKRIGFATVGENVLISDKATFYNPAKITIGDNVRIDDFCVLSAGLGGIEIGSYIHIAVYTCLIGKGRIILNDFCNISSRVSIYSSSDDYSGKYMTNPMIPEDLTNVNSNDIYIGKHVIVGSGSVILPGSRLEEGSALGALTLVKGNVPFFEIHAGVPAKFIKKREKNIIEIEKKNFS